MFVENPSATAVEVESGLTPAESFRRAKAEHYFDRAAEYVLMARYGKAKKMLEIVLSLDPANKPSRELQKVIEQDMRSIVGRSKNGAGSGPERGDTGPVRTRKRNELVMVVDQDEQLLATLVAALRRYGFHAIGAGSYDEALETLEIVKPDIVVSEVNFENGPRGFDLYMYIKTRATPEIPFMFLAARIDRELLIAGKRFGVDDFMQKPVDDEVVTASVVNCLARRRVAQPAG